MVQMDINVNLIKLMQKTRISTNHFKKALSRDCGLNSFPGGLREVAVDGAVAGPTFLLNRAKEKPKLEMQGIFLIKFPNE